MSKLKWFVHADFYIIKPFRREKTFTRADIIGIVRCSDEIVKYRLPREYKQTQCLFTNLRRVSLGFMTTINYISSWKLTLLY